MFTGRDVVAVPSRPPARSWHTPKESANQTLALDSYECQQGHQAAASRLGYELDVMSHPLDDCCNGPTRRP
jgi:hypothetical protein